MLGGQHVLLVLDNCEHVLAAAAALADRVLGRCPMVTILATSREVLSVAGETVWGAPCLSLPPADAADPDDLAHSDAAALFIVRARTAQPGFGAVAANAGAIARICHRLDGIPLALELAAARVPVLSASQLADRLDDRFRLLTSGPRSAPVRHQTLRAAMDWSFDLLAEPEQRLLRRLSVFPQDFDLEAATAVAGDDADPIDVIDLLARLVDKSLVVSEGAAETARYRLLETVRQYGAEKLTATGETDEARRRHRRHFAGRVMMAFRDKLLFPGLEWGRRATREMEHYNAALVSALAESDVEVAAALTLAALAHEAAGRPAVAARLLGGAAGVAGTLGEPALPLPAVAELVVAMGGRLGEAFGAEFLAEAKATGRNMPVPSLLNLAADGLDASRLGRAC